MAINKNSLKEGDIVKVSIKKTTLKGIETEIKYSEVNKYSKDIILQYISDTLQDTLVAKRPSFSSKYLFDENVEVLEIITEKQQIEYLKNYIKQKGVAETIDYDNPFENHISNFMGFYNEFKDEDEKLPEITQSNKDRITIKHINNVLIFLSIMSVSIYAGILLLLFLK